MLTSFIDKVNDLPPQRMLAAANPLSDDPEVRPTPLKALLLSEAPTELHFVRSHFGIPPLAAEWLLEIEGAVSRPTRISLDDLRRRPPRTRAVVLECAGHRRSEFEPGTSGLQWGAGAVSEARWSGVPLAQLLGEAAPTDVACEVVFEGADRGAHRNAPSAVPFARSIPLEWAASGDVLLAWEMNGHPIPPKHGGPLRAIVPGCYGVDSVKWLRRIEVCEQPFLGAFQANDYRLLGLDGQGNGTMLHRLPVSALIVKPAAGPVVLDGPLAIRGVAWGGDGGISAVDVRLRGGEWSPAVVARPSQKHGLARWSTLLGASPGELTIEVRARDGAGNVQPEVPPWNACGYGNNSIHRVAVTALAPEEMR